MEDEISGFISLFHFFRLQTQCWRSDSGLQAALDEAPHTSNGPCISLMFPPVNEGDEAGRVQEAFITPRAWLQPCFLQAEPSWRSLGWVGPQQQADKVLCGLADTLEVVPGEAEVQAADVLASLLSTLIQEGGGATQKHICHHAQAPQIRSEGHWFTQDQFWGCEFRTAQQRMAGVAAVELHGVTKVCQLHYGWATGGAVEHQEVLGL